MFFVEPIQQDPYYHLNTVKALKMLTQDEAELYDRQIRLWGVNAQSRIRQAKILMLGFNGVASEVAKILTLAGVGCLTIVDDSPLQPTDLYSNLFCRQTDDIKKPQTYRTHAVAAKLKKLNPLVKVDIINRPILSFKKEEYANFDLVTLHFFLSIADTIKINEICRECHIKFYIVVDYGFYGFLFSDLGEDFKYTYEDYSEPKKQSTQTGREKDPISFEENNTEEDKSLSSTDDENDPPKKKRRIYSPNRTSQETSNEKTNLVRSLSFVPFNKMVDSDSKVLEKQTSPVLLVSIALYKFYSQYHHLPREDPKFRLTDCENLKAIVDSVAKLHSTPDSVMKKLNTSWYDNIFGSLSPICAILGGVAGQDMIRAISCKDTPLYNTFAFDGVAMNGTVEKLGINSIKGNIVQPIVRDLLVIDDDED